MYLINNQNIMFQVTEKIESKKVRINYKRKFEKFDDALKYAKSLIIENNGVLSASFSIMNEIQWNDLVKTNKATDYLCGVYFKPRTYISVFLCNEKSFFFNRN